MAKKNKGSKDKVEKADDIDPRPRGVKKPQVRLVPAMHDNMYHVRFLFETRSHREVDPHLTGDAPASMLAHQQFLMRCLGKDRQIFIIQDRTELVGYCQLRLAGDDAGELGWVVHPDHQGKGYGKASVALLVEEAKRRGFGKVHLYVKVTNVKAFKIYEDFGFELESEADGVVRMTFT